jgi:hypothetical protein
MKLKYQYALSMIGIALGSFGTGWLVLSKSLGIQDLSNVNAFGLIVTGLGLAILIKTLSTIKKIDLIIEEVDEDDEE